jgi:hypothetical protein
LIAATACGTTSRPAGLPSQLPIAAPLTSDPATTHRAAPRDQVHAVVRRYFEVLNRLHAEMDSTALARLLTPDCPCQQQVEAIRTAAANGQRYLDRTRIKALRVNLDGPGAADVLADYQLVRGGLVDAAGRHLTRITPHRLRWDFRLRRVNGQWRINRIDDLT